MSDPQPPRLPPSSHAKDIKNLPETELQTNASGIQPRTHVRHISLEQHGVTKQPVKIEKLPTDLDDFGLPLKNSRSSRANSVGSDGVGHDTSTSKGQHTGTTAFRRRSRSVKETSERSRSISASRAGRTEVIHEEGSNIEHKQDELDVERGRRDTVQDRPHSTAISSDRSLAGSRAGSRARSKTADDATKNPDVEATEEDQRRSRATTMSKVMETAGSQNTGGVSEWSHQALAPKKEEIAEEKEEEWQDMPALGEYDIYDDDGRLVAKGARGELDEGDKGGAGKGYTRVQIDDDAKSATSMDENTSYLFKEKGTNVVDEDEDARDPLAQMQATKDLLTEGQRIAYVGAARLAMIQLLKELDNVVSENKQVKKDVASAVEAMKMWSQKMMVRLYGHMDIDAAGKLSLYWIEYLMDDKIVEQVMIEQLAEHGVQTSDLTPALMQSARVKNPMAEAETGVQERKDDASSDHSTYATPEESNSPTTETPVELREVQSPTQLPGSKNIDIDLRWTVLCDLFLVLIADSIYDARSRKLLELVAEGLNVKWLDICRFEKRVTDALEMQEEAARENWDEAQHMEDRRKKSLKRKYMYMGLATVGGSLIIGLSAGLLAPVIGAGLAAGFTTIGVAGTSGFLAGAGGTALIATIGVTTGGSIAIKASNRRMGAVKTFEYRPLHNNKRVNLIVTVSGWMNGKVDDVRLPFSTVDPIMGDVYSIHWEPDMLQSIGDTVRILATEALSTGLQQVLAATILTTLMAALALPVWLLKLSYLVDNPWSVSMDRADAAGLILADSLCERNLGARPITLVGFSLGARVIFSCLKEMVNKGAYGLIQNVYLFGSPIVANIDEYNRVSTIISGRFVNGYATNDWILGYLFRATKGGISRVAGLKALEGAHGLENLDVTEFVEGHMAYRAAMPRLLRHVGWEVESDEFDEIIDPDPENHEARQRELIKEIEEARREAEKPEKKRFGFFKRGKPADKKNWETYDEKMGAEKGESNGNYERKNPRVLFDIEAIKRELASEAIEVRQLESTLPTMHIDIHSPKTPTGTETIQSPNEDSATLSRQVSRQPSISLEAPEDSSTNQENAPQAVTPRDRSPSLLQRMFTGGKSPTKEQNTPTPLPASNTPLPSAALAWRQQSRSPSPSPEPASVLPPSQFNTLHSMPPEKNAWNDLEDEDEVDWNQERRVVMSFE